MEAPEEFTASNDHTLTVKGKRAKRKRPFSQYSMAMAVTSSSSSGGGGGGDHVYSSLPSPTSSGELSTTTEEDEDMANCLILLAQGFGPKQPEDEEEEREIEKFGGRRFTETVTTAAGKPAFLVVYECKTCNRSFPSFQALGGHRASHKRPKASVEEKREVLMAPAAEEEEAEEEERQRNNKISPSLSFQMAAAKASQINSKSKVHECSICGSEFSSGQALGGHMRRHRAPPNAQTAVSSGRTTVESHVESVKPRNILPLDLNLPAPPEDDHHRDAEFQFTPNKQHLVFSAPALVDCYY